MLPKKYMLFFSALFLISSFSRAQDTLTVRIDKPYAEIQPTMWGVFFEDINFAADGGIYAELVKNRSFEFYDPKMGWRTVKKQEGDGEFYIFNRTSSPENPRFARIRSRLETGSFGIENEGFRGLPVRKNRQYRFTLMARNPGDEDVKLKVQLLNAKDEIVGEAELEGFTGGWNTHQVMLTSSVTDPHGKLNVLIEGKGTLDMDMVSLFPTDTWQNRENGLRADIVQMVADLHPGFIRFPGGCIVEGHELETRYQWKKTVGKPENRHMIINRWNNVMRHRKAPDYFQSFGLGFYEYFLLAEDLDAEPLPILNCGMACQYNTGELVPLDELDPYIQDALDLIEFANGPVTSKWGKVRSDMGHPKPFKLKYIGIGNEQWGYQYVERYNRFARAIRAKYPDIKLVSGSGPRPNDSRFEYLWTQLPNMDVDLVDEHFYMSPEWFMTNADRYDKFDHEGLIIFPGEYAAHGPEGEYASSRNTWLSALAEAAFMTGFERNADIVHMCSYAPLLAHVDAWQWRPDLIWFDNLNVFGTPNYYVQKLYSTHAGTHVIPVLQDSLPLIGQDQLYASSTIDMKMDQVYIKLINTSEEPKKVIVNLQGGIPRETGTKALVMHADDLMAYNSMEEPKKIAPVEIVVPNADQIFSYVLGPESFHVIVMDLKPD